MESPKSVSERKGNKWIKWVQRYKSN
jgi:hypothetical protein